MTQRRLPAIGIIPLESVQPMNRPKSAYDSCLEKMFSLQRFGIKLGLETIRDILEALGNPQNAYRCIHIAGTNGKGSIASSLARILHLSGFQVGLYTSPHLVKFNERIQINGCPISDERVVALYEKVRTADQGERQATFFEFATAMALYEFARSNVDWALIETGMGGRLDATNIILPKLSIITNIALEHKEYLGNTLAQIAAEKGGIIKPEVPVVTGVGQKNVITVVEEIARKQNAQCYRKGKDFRTRRKADRKFDYYGIRQNLKDVSLGLAGDHQYDNAAVVLAACEQLIDQGINLPQDSIRKALANNHWPGRLEKVLDQPTVILDGAHNLMAARMLAGYIKKELNAVPTTLIVGILDDKPYEAMLKSLVPACRKIIITKPKINRALSPEKLLEIVRPMNPEVEIIEDVATALHKTIEQSNPSEAICVAGSLYVVGEAKEALQKQQIIP